MRDKIIKLLPYGIIFCLTLAVCLIGIVRADNTASTSQTGTASNSSGEKQTSDSQTTTDQQTDSVPVTDVDVQGDKDGSADSGYRTDTAQVGSLGDQSLQDTPFK